MTPGNNSSSTVKKQLKRMISRLPVCMQSNLPKLLLFIKTTFFWSAINLCVLQRAFIGKSIGIRLFGSTITTTTFMYNILLNVIKCIAKVISIRWALITLVLVLSPKRLEVQILMTLLWQMKTSAREELQL